MLRRDQQALVDLVHSAEDLQRAREVMWDRVSVALDAGVGPQQVARIVGVHPSTLYRLLKRHGPADRRLIDGRKRWYTDGYRYHRGVRA